MSESMPSAQSVEDDEPSPTQLDEDAAPVDGMEPDTAADAAGEMDTSGSVSTSSAVLGGRTVLEGPASENEEMRRGTEALNRSEENSAAARQFADDLARSTEPKPAAEA